MTVDEWLEQAAMEYHSECDTYDRTVCSAVRPDSNEPIPADGREFGLVNRHARETLERLAKQYGVSKCDLRKAIVRYGRQP